MQTLQIPESGFAGQYLQSDTGSSANEARPSQGGSPIRSRLGTCLWDRCCAGSRNIKPRKGRNKTKSIGKNPTDLGI